jgi:glucosamine--fructose-6-phosphate aminotransferase (isomerizing)
LSSAEAPLAGDPAPAGAQFLTEIREQPRALERLLEHDREYARVAEAARSRGAVTVRMIGHGSSDNAASYGVYAFGILPHWTAFRDSISLGIYYRAGLDLSGSAVLGLSQSGRTPDVVEYVEHARAGGAFTIAVTNDTTSALGEVAEAVLPLAAGDERAVAATKTYITQLAAIGLLAAHAAGEGGRFAESLRRVIDQLDELIPRLEEQIVGVALPFTFTGRMFVVGRGTEFSTARETALKLLETCRLAAEPLTATDLAHGPVAALDSQFPVWTIASHDEALPAVVEGAARVRAAGATLIATGSAADAVGAAEYVLPVPRPPIPLLAPLLSVVPGQLFSWALARAKGLDPDTPRGLTKITLAR